MIQKFKSYYIVQAPYKILSEASTAFLLKSKYIELFNSITNNEWHIGAVCSQVYVEIWLNTEEHAETLLLYFKLENNETLYYREEME